MAEISPLRRRMIEDMTVRNLSPATQRSYVNAVSKFSQYFDRSPDRLGLEDVRAFQVHLASKGVSWASLNQIVCALRFFYGVTLGQDDIPERIAYAREPRTVSSVVKWSQRHRATGSVAPGMMGGHRKPTLDAHKDFIKERIEQTPHLTLHGLKDALGARGKGLAQHRVAVPAPRRSDVQKKPSSRLSRRATTSPAGVGGHGRIVSIPGGWSSSTKPGSKPTWRRCAVGERRASDLLPTNWIVFG
jgi:hypothetical protein